MCPGESVAHPKGIGRIAEESPSVSKYAKFQVVTKRYDFSIKNISIPTTWRLSSTHGGSHCAVVEGDK